MRTRNILRTPLICFMISCLLCTVAGHATGKTKPKEPAPRFNATTTRGEKFNNDSIKGKVVLLEFWTTWCGYCLQEAGFVDRINDAYANKGLIRGLRASFLPTTPIWPPCLRPRFTPFTL